VNTPKSIVAAAALALPFAALPTLATDRPNIVTMLIDN